MTKEMLQKIESYEPKTMGYFQFIDRLISICFKGEGYVFGWDITPPHALAIEMVNTLIAWEDAEPGSGRKRYLAIRLMRLERMFELDYEGCWW